MNIKSIKIFAVVFMLFILGACTQGRALEIGDQAPDFTLQDINGKPVQLSTFKGNVIILDFFASWCPPCKDEVPHFIELQKAYAGKGFSVIGVSLVSLEEAKEFASKAGINYPVVIDDGKVSDAVYGPIRSIPTTFIIDKNLKVAKIYIGYQSKEIFESDILALLQ